VYFGFGGLARFTFLSVGFWVVMVASIAFALVYAVGPTRGKLAARMWTDSSLVLALIGSAVDLLWALESGEGRAFVDLYGAGPLAGVVALAVLLMGAMWWMAIRYTDGLKD
jgi:hypothetical protein